MADELPPVSFPHALRVNGAVHQRAIVGQLEGSRRKRRIGEGDGLLRRKHELVGPGD